MLPKISLQLWSVREDLAKDFKGTLEKVKAAGYDGVEFAGYEGHSSQEVKEILAEVGLVVSSSHIPFEALENDLEAVLAFEKEIGNSRIVIPWLSFKDYQGWKEAFTKLDALGKTLTERGFSLAYHNHDHEFREIAGVDLLHYLTAHTSYVSLEVDLYWLAKGQGVDNVSEWLLDHARKISLLHFKDQTADEKESTEIGHGILPMKDYLAFAKEQEIPWLIVEQEAFQDYPPLEAVDIDAKNLSKLRDEVYK